MNYCKAITSLGKPCKNSSNCGIHSKVNCLLCNRENRIRECYKLKNCGHSFCTMCLVDDFYEFQWFDDFNSEHPIMCPNCDRIVCKSDYDFITNFLCECKVLKRKSVCEYYLCPEMYNKLFGIIEIGKKYNLKDIKNVKDINLKVYFQKFTEPFNETYCTFLYGTKKIKNLFAKVQKELLLKILQI